MAQILNFQVMEVVGATREEALNQAPFDIMGDATQAYKSWKSKQTGTITEADKKQFMLDYLAKKSKNVAGVGFSITNESAVVDTRKRPYTIKDHKREGASKKVTTYQLYENLGTDANPKRGRFLGETTATYVQAVDKDKNPIMNEDGTPKMVWKAGTKAKAKELGKELYTKKDEKCNIVCYVTSQVVSGEPVAFTMNYTPSINAKNGSYTVFGVAR